MKKKLCQIWIRKRIHTHTHLTMTLQKSDPSFHEMELEEMCERITGESRGRKDGGSVEKHICGQKAFAPSCSGGPVLAGQQHPWKITHTRERYTVQK